MKIIISPAKSLDYETALPTDRFTSSDFMKQSWILNKVIKEKTPAQLSELMHISDKLADLNWKRNKEFNTPFTPENARPAIYAFNGDVYSGIDAYTIPIDKLDQLQDQLRILSGLYGYLKPLDLVQPYRLEMGTSLHFEDNKNLYDFWKPTLTESLNKEMKEGELLINLASKEYASALDFKKLKATIVTPDFKDYKDGKLKIISFYAKKARGMMVRYIIDTNAKTLDDLKGFDYDGYKLDGNLSKGENLIFTR
ncbi:peroxide stress protein YaaA [Flavobacterium antarcticum]|uniref:peroxide stress protein YaaA n=1 Tax=Flavobacterium antarcticum TaxID=271155 RepID=UPI0003B5E59E|nr:peroxide stress protein YaaA [Flavobacterium antarcticum]